MPTEFFGIEGLTPVMQRTIAIFVFTALMWIIEVIPTWTTSVVSMVNMLFLAWVLLLVMFPFKTEKIELKIEGTSQAPKDHKILFSLLWVRRFLMILQQAERLQP